MKYCNPFLLVMVLALSACMHIPTAKHSPMVYSKCYFTTSNGPIQFAYSEFAQPLADFQTSNYPLDIIAIRIRPGKQDNTLKRLIQDSSGYLLMTFNHGEQPLRTIGYDAKLLTLLDSATVGHYSLDDLYGSGHTPAIGLLIRRNGVTQASYYFNLSPLKCSEDSLNQRVRYGYDAAHYLLSL